MSNALLFLILRQALRYFYSHCPKKINTKKIKHYKQGTYK